MSSEVAILVFISVVNLSLGLLILARNPRSLSCISFFALSVSISAWAASNYLTEADVALSINALFNKLAYLFGFLCLVSITVFCYSFSSATKVSFLKRLFFGGFVLVISILSLTDLIAGKVSRDAEGLHFTVGSLSIVYILSFLGLLIISGRKLIKTARKSDRQTKRQIQLILAGFVISVTLGLFTNVIIPSFSDSFETAKFGPVLTVFVVGTTTYAIARHQLFNIKRAIARSVAYLLSLGLIGLLYGAVLYLLSSVLADHSDFDNTARLIYISLALGSAIVFSPIKRFFDKVTRRIFYRDAYDPQQFLDELNSTVVENIELGILLRHTTGVIQENLKSQFCYIEIKGTETTKGRLVGIGEFNLSEQEDKLLKGELGRTGKRTIITDELGPEFSGVREMLFHNNIAVIVRLLRGNDVSRDDMYYLILGDKKSGNIYDKQDIRILEIIADELLIAIQNSLRFEEIQQFNVTLQEKVNDATAKLQKTNKKLREMDETKDEFISMASHQLRTPLTSVKGYMSMVMEGDAGKLNKKQETLLNQAFVSSQRMVYLIADLLNVSRLKTGKFIIDAQPTNLADVVEGEISQLMETAKNKKIKLKYDKPKNFPKLLLDETKIRQVIMNFADNAIYYTPTGGNVNIDLKEDDGHIYFRVKDDGLGVPQADQAKLFTKFYRASNARKARPDGTGLGLFMAKKVVDAQEGTILFESREGKGSTFGFSFDKRKLSPDNPTTKTKEDN